MYEREFRSINLHAQITLHLSLPIEKIEVPQQFAERCYNP